MSVIIADKNGQIDSAYHTLIKYVDSKYPIVMVSWAENFVFNDALLSIKDYVLVCFCEYGWDYEITDSHIWGVSKAPKRYSGGEWDRFDEWVRGNPPKLMFKRELLKKDVSDTVKPIEYACVVDIPEIDSKHKFDERLINAFQYWGRSNENRMRVHGEIWLHAYKKGFQVCDNIYYVNNYLVQEQGEKWVTLWIPHWARLDIKTILSINGLSKLSLSWAGAGFKCFRTAEAPSNSTMVMQKNNFAWAYDWDETNCILVKQGKEIEGIEAALHNPNLYEIYKAGVKNCKKYQTENYINHYILHEINKV